MTNIPIPDPEFAKVFREGLDLFNAGQFFECHELWEHLWLDEGDADRAQVLKGLLQAAIAIHHFRRNNLEGARKLYVGQRRILAPYLTGALGLDLATFAREMEACCDGLTRIQPGDAPQLDGSKVPKLREPGGGSGA